MASKNHYLPVKKKKGMSVIDSSNGQYSNLNLNHNSQRFLEGSVSSKSATTNDNKKAGLNFINNLPKSKESYAWNNSTKNLRSDLFERSLEKHKHFHQNQSSYHQNKNNSTLSLHIKAYENSVEGITASKIEKAGIQKNKGKIGLIKSSSKNTVSARSNIKNSYEFLRQQEDDQIMDPEVMQFKPFQRLFNPNNYIPLNQRDNEDTDYSKKQTFRNERQHSELLPSTTEYAESNFQNMMNEDGDDFRIWRLRVTALYMIADRGYDVRPEELNQTLTQFKSIYGEKPSREDLSILVTHSDDITDQLLVVFADEQRITNESVNRFYRRMEEQRVPKALVICREGITTQAKDTIDEHSNRYSIELVPENDLIGGTTENDASDIVDEKAELLNRYKYGDFMTIDWLRDLARDRKRHKYISSQKSDFPFGFFRSFLDAVSGWICVLFVGLAAGSTAGIIDIGARWMSDLKDGICADRFWLDREHCCWSASDTISKEADCSSWTTWPEMLGYYNQSFFYYVFDFFFYVLWAVLMAGFSVSLVKVFAPYACGSGIPEIKCVLSGFCIRGYLGKWTFVIKAVGLILSSASGLSLGKEGPMVHLACCIGNIFSYVFPKYGNNEAKKREILSASAAAGVSVAFGAPIGGVLFSLEEASYYFPLKTMWRSFFCALIAGIVLRFVNPFGSDQTSLFHVDYAMKWTFMELLPFALLGVFGGCLGSLFIWSNISWCKFRKNNKILGQNPVYEVLVVTALTASVAYWNPYTRKSASSLIKQLFERCGPDKLMDWCDYTLKSDTVSNNHYSGGDNGVGTTAFWQLIFALACKLIFTIFTFGIKVPSGLFVPSLAMGALAGRLLGMQVESFVTVLQSTSSNPYWTCQIGKDCVMPGLYAMVGAAAVLGGVTRMTISLVVIMFELTGSLEFIVPTMVAVMFAKWVGDAIYPMGIYDAHIDLNGYPFLDNKGEYPYSTVAMQVMRPGGADKSQLKVIYQDQMVVGEIENLMRETSCNGFPVVNDADMFVVGYVTRRDLQIALTNARKSYQYVTTNSKVYFSNNVPDFDATGSSPAPLRLKKIIDLAPMTLSAQTPMEIVIDMFRKLGLRQILITENGRLRGVITKKDILRFMKEGEF